MVIFMSNPQPSCFGLLFGWVAVALLGFEVMTTAAGQLRKDLQERGGAALENENQRQDRRNQYITYVFYIVFHQIRAVSRQIYTILVIVGYFSGLGQK